ncbi:anti-sigma factor family protein [Roseixanthobacter liquoris]|uniref:anti-sigma factor family protein n=1 Tax=Roseixanthobacter liquoris TaxID=3119921 RepID=UPI00372CD811
MTDAHSPDPAPDSEPAACAEWEVMLSGFVDGELDAAHAFACETHLAQCAGCAAALARLRATRHTLAQQDVRWPVPDALRAGVAAMIARETAALPHGSADATGAARRWRTRLDRAGRWSFLPSAAVLAAGLFLLVLPPRPAPAPGLADEVVASHVRSLLADHLTDIATSNQHTVKPWFSGKLDFSPPVVDLAARSFALVGGRVDYVGGRVVAALIYRRNAHVINVFIWPATSAPQSAATREGYSLMSWTQAGLTFWIVSDLNTVELKEFQEDLVDALPK